MKKAIFALILIFAGYQIKAQSTFQYRPFDSLLNTLLNKSLKTTPRAGKYDKYLKTKIKEGFSWGDHRPYIQDNSFRMPIVILAGFDNMPIAKLGGLYTMPVKKITEFDELCVEKRLFLLPLLTPDSTIKPNRLKLLNSF